MYLPTNDGWMYPVPGTFWRPKYGNNNVDLTVEITTQQFIGCVTYIRWSEKKTFNSPWELFFQSYERVSDDELRMYLEA